ncbi:hypothetical protein TNCT_332581 [Trichonephila clavata]|uniref:Uncharacterized protein n=1 Tax=Trichonephila clavata TaxID=2740835 RepID=A0A8X6FTA1_TRICU|nr:hypothetical protein TNCT_332581 [Trichonephila clavata]
MHVEVPLTCSWHGGRHKRPSLIRELSSDMELNSYQEARYMQEDAYLKIEDRQVDELGSFLRCIILKNFNMEEDFMICCNVAQMSEMFCFRNEIS